MRVLLIGANTERINMVTLPIGLGMVAAATRRAGHQVRLLDLLMESDPLEALRKAIADDAPEVIGISVRNIDDQASQGPRLLLDKAREVIETCREHSSSPVVVGGPGFSIFPSEALAFLGADWGVWGEGEDVFPALLERLASGQDPRDLPGVLGQGDGPPALRASVTNLHDAPMWDDALHSNLDPKDPMLWIPLQARRGCPNDCSYCSTSMIQGRQIRTRDPRRVADQVERLAAVGFQRFYFVDNSFNIPRHYALELVEELRKLSRPLMWRCILYPERVDEELVAAMAAAGCVEVALGFESGAPSVLKEMNKRYSPADVRQTSDLLRAHGIRRFGFLLFGGPGETRETVEESIAFATSLGLDGLRVTVGIRIYPSTPLAKRAIEEGVLRAEENLLEPRFYVAPGLEPWIRDRVAGLGL